VQGPYELTTAGIDRNVRRRSAGAYLLYMSRHDRAVYVGRSDSDLNQRLKDHVYENAGFAYFRFAYCCSPEDAFEKECELYHYFEERGQIRNSYHPAKPWYSDCNCPVCGITYY